MKEPRTILLLEEMRGLLDLLQLTFPETLLSDDFTRIPKPYHGVVFVHSLFQDVQFQEFELQAVKEESQNLFSSYILSLSSGYLTLLHVLSMSAMRDSTFSGSDCRMQSQ